ncbi:hypothetical protein b4567 [Escherichia coli K-12]|nr:hypothetical protein b4567 [Escherichia coli K-12]
MGSVAAGIADCRADVCGFIVRSVADCHSDGISIDADDAVSQTVAALHFATIVPGTYCWHHADDNEFESGMKNQGRNKKGSKDNWCEGGDLNPHVRKDTNT